MKANKLTPNFEVKDIKQTVKFYQENLGFNLIMAVPEAQDGVHQTFIDDMEYVYGLVSKDNVELMFQRTDTFKADVVFSKALPIAASVSFYMEVEGVEAFYKEISEKNIVTTDLKTAWYGMKEFYMKDNNGYILGIAEKVQVENAI